MFTLVARWKMEDGPPRGRVYEPDEGAPFVAMVHRGDGALPIETPHLVQNRFQPDALLVDRPEFDRGVGERGRDGADKRADLF
jgi:hypothetical protein